MFWITIAGAGAVVCLVGSIFAWRTREKKRLEKAEANQRLERWLGELEREGEAHHFPMLSSTRRTGR